MVGSVVDQGNNRIQVYENNKPMFAHTVIRFSMCGVTNDLLLLVTLVDKILVFDETGNLTGSWESRSLGHQLNGPCDLQIGPEGDYMLRIIIITL